VPRTETVTVLFTDLVGSMRTLVFRSSRLRGMATNEDGSVDVELAGPAAYAAPF